jgi:hypothetical protein
LAGVNGSTRFGTDDALDLINFVLRVDLSFNLIAQLFRE